MNYEQGFPKTMVHPSYRPAIISDAAIGTAQSYAGQPARFLPQMVHTPEEEEDMRARGYLNPGEPPAQAHYAEFPKILRHPRYAPAAVATKKSVIAKSRVMVDGQLQLVEDVQIIDVPAREAQYPDVIVASETEEKHWRERGWSPAGSWDADAFERAHSVPEVEYNPNEWPKWIDGPQVDKDGNPIKICVQDPDSIPAEVIARQASEYPKHFMGRVVRNVEEEAALANGGEAAPPATPSAAVAAPQPALDVAALKREIITELRDTLFELLSEEDENGPLTSRIRHKRHVRQMDARLAKVRATSPHKHPQDVEDWNRGKTVPKPRPGNPVVPPELAKDMVAAGMSTENVIVNKPMPLGKKREYTAEERKAIGERFKAGREAARLRREQEASDERSAEGSMDYLRR